MVIGGSGALGKAFISHFNSLAYVNYKRACTMQSFASLENY